MATTPLSGTNIRLLSNVPFNSDYKNTRWFDSKTQQTNYFLNKPIVHAMEQANFQRIEGYNFIAVNKSIDELWGTNYLMFQNASYNNKWFYAFVTNLEYKQRNTTWVHFQIDVFQTWKFDMNFKPSFVVREHCKLWNSDGSPVINTVDEGLNYGTDYETVSVEKVMPYDEEIFFMVIVAKEKMHVEVGEEMEKEIVPTLNGLPQPLSYYIHPFKMDGTTPNVVLGSGSYEVSDILTTLKSIFTQENAVNNVVSVYITDYIGVRPPYDSSSNTMEFASGIFGQAMISDGVNPNIQTIYIKNMENYVSTSRVLGGVYEGYHSVNESKLLMWPYTVLILDDFKGNRVELKNEYIDDKNLRITIRGSLGTSNKVSYSVTDYLAKDLEQADRLKTSLEYSVINNNANDVPILNDYLSAYLQGNRNSIETQKSSILFNGVMNAIGGAIGGVASAGQLNGTGVASAGTNVVQGLGNTQLQLQGIESKIKDIDNTPASLVKMGGNTSYDYGNNYNGVYVIKKQITEEYRRKLEDYFNMFGYKVNEVKIPNFHTRRYWNYVQTSSCVITGNFNNEDLQELKNVFDNGITLWHTDDVGNYALSNEVI